MAGRLKYLIIIQARVGSTRLPGKSLMTVGGIPMVKRVWDAAKKLEQMFPHLFKVIVAWPERYPDLDENNVLERFKRLINEFAPKYVVRLTADCPLIEHWDITNAVVNFENNGYTYYSNHLDGSDVQVFDPYNCSVPFDKEHVLADPIKTPDTGLSVNTKEDLERVRRIVNGK